MDAILLIVVGVGLTIFLLRLESWPSNRLPGPLPAGDTAWAMSEENVEVVRRALEAWGRGDREAVVDLLDPAVEWSMPPNLPDAGTYRGRGEVVGRLEEFLEAWDDLAVTVEELVDAGDRVVALVRYSGRGRESGIEIAGMNTDAQVWTVRNGRALRVELYGGTAEALKAVGLSE
jgi:uncharacterized protein